ncbi:hypothetical protein BIV57_03685 [Mangrovactinospora gilvigrisea]|uniref:Septation ring formation regulator EzrA n=1 Tax=Mangrovactinospora gilvigrisea TaxID=1428644 RepID=A0A1J7CGQ8_9ACTN|nr:septum formation initiator family protein [Mangrovactinospora gilvigrisea]OIV38850.1 hypothetical protein BIV57_03685 [Mangrovactinospora gilvigrisea]
MVRRRLTSRAAVLAFVLAGLVIALAVPTRQYIAQRGQIADQRRQAAAADREVKTLRREAARWQDPSYVEAQARARLHFVRPGETGFVFPQGSPGGGDAPVPGGGASASGQLRPPWYQSMWSSVDSAAATDAASDRTTQSR